MIVVVVFKSDMEQPLCPDCGALLSFIRLRDQKGRLGLRITCEMCDYEGIDIDLGVNRGLLKKFRRKQGNFKANLQQVVSLD